MSFEVPCSSEILISFYICSAAALVIGSAEKHFFVGLLEQEARRDEVKSLSCRSALRS